MKDFEKHVSIKPLRTEIIQLHCTPEERALIQREATVRAGGNVDAYLLSLVKFVKLTSEMA